MFIVCWEWFINLIRLSVYHRVVNIESFINVYILDFPMESNEIILIIPMSITRIRLR